MIKDYIQEAVTQSMQAVAGVRASGTKPRAKNASKQKRDSSPGLEISSGDSSGSDEPSEYLFDFQLIDPYIVAVKEAIDWEQDTQPPEKN